MNQFPEDQPTEPGLLQNIQNGSLITALVAGTRPVAGSLQQLHKPTLKMLHSELHLLEHKNQQYWNRSHCTVSHWSRYSIRN
ncbi:unnamed protein product [Paramecium primaurelia]|uniref:Uncharacterized protein n=1 Tax=Paramecium primaurelia TaxID=5886 RepID=A0A8S1PE05_PARPR|nr:unnamed protein product [Paramecium primaurelia]